MRNTKQASLHSNDYSSKLLRCTHCYSGFLWWLSWFK